MAADGRGFTAYPVVQALGPASPYSWPMPSVRAAISQQVGTRTYRVFLQELHCALADDSTHDAEPLLNGRAGSRCLDLLPETTARRLGAFFTPSETAQSLAHLVRVRRWADTLVFDPACGAGDLLLPIARKLPVRETASQTLKLWNQHLHGCDLSAEFVQAARLRMVLLATTRGAEMDAEADTLAALCDNLWVGDGLRQRKAYKEATHILMNPPFVRVRPPVAVPWRQGLVTKAAIFMDHAIRESSEGTQILALLPEVLRTGTSYAMWRAHIARYAVADRTRSMGLFSPNADIDVFVQRLIRRRRPVERKIPKRRVAKDVVGTHFAVHVGPVVPHRHPKAGAKRAFLHAGNAAPWADLTRINEKRRFDGTLFEPPFVVIRRTSRPGDPNRATASLVLGQRKVAVENHLIVAKPLRGRAPLCRKLVRLLGSPQTDIRLDRVMRCRHLTVASIRGIPWSPEPNV